MDVDSTENTSDVIYISKGLHNVSEWPGVFNESNSLNSTDSIQPVKYYTVLYRTVGITLATIVLVAGIVGNSMVAIVVARTKTMRTPTNCYIVSLAISDILVLVACALPVMMELNLKVGQWILGKTGCNLVIYLQYLGVNASAMSITAFTIERYFGICHPMRAHAICTVKRAVKIIVFIWIFNVLYNSTWIFLTNVTIRRQSDNTTIESCEYTGKRSDYVYIYMVDLCLFYIIPLCLTCVLYGFIAYILCSGSIASSTAERLGHNGTNSQQHQSSPSTLRKNSTSNSRTQVVKMLVIVVGLFAILWLPYRVLVVYNSFAKETYMDPWFLMFCRTMVYINSAINPILYNAMSGKFRRAFKNLFVCGRKAGQGSFTEIPMNARTPPSSPDNRGKYRYTGNQTSKKTDEEEIALKLSSGRKTNHIDFV
ncbi:unnamed protein product [Owenia fusiformis]|uniref:Thyrotropin-releasing hormone receptor n=1 Tax=Owenia fusiformis TaxID=6347 RepID=A0A8S4NDP0_OWEFU|nr:unnamed protein product [Owenia fusiformis]